MPLLNETWRSNLLPSLLSLQTFGLATDLQLVTVGQQGDLQEPLLAHSLVLAAASPTLATLLATSRETGQVTLIMPGLEREEMEGMLEDIYLGRDRARVFLQQWGFQELSGISLEEQGDFEKLEFQLKEDAQEEYNTFFQHTSSHKNGNGHMTKDIFLEEPKSQSSVLLGHEIHEGGNLMSESQSRIGKDIATNSHRIIACPIPMAQTQGTKFNDGEIPSTAGPVCPVLDCSWQYTSHPALKNHIKMYHKDELDQSSLNTKLKESFKICFDKNNYITNVNVQSADDVSTDERKNPKSCITSHSNDQSTFKFPNPNDHIKKGKTSKEYMLERENVTTLESGKLQCPKCGRQFSEWASLRKHYEYIHENIKDKCEFCGYESIKKHVAIHVKRKHGSERYKCKQCKYTSTMKADVRKHHAARHNGEKHMCEDCGLEYLSPLTLQKHKTAKHSGVFLQCDQCDYKMDGQLGTMNTHKRRMHESSKFLCIYCPYIANNKDDMEEHKETLHIDEIQHKSPTVKNHEQRRKEREKKMDFTCKECGKKYTARNGFRFHMNSVHRGIRFPCPETGCDYRATLKHALLMHTESKHSEMRHNCDICNYSTGNTDALKNHKERTHQISDSVFPCDKCGMRSRDPDKTRKHMLTMHS